MTLIFNLLCYGKVRYHDEPHLISDKTSLSGGGTAYQDVKVIMGLIEVGYQVMHAGLIKGALLGVKCGSTAAAGGSRV